MYSRKFGVRLRGNVQKFLGSTDYPPSPRSRGTTAGRQPALSRQSPLPVYYFFRREGGDDFFEARIAAQRLPTRIEAEIAVRCASRDFRESFQLLNSQVVFASLRADHRIEIKDVRTIEGVFCHRQKLNGLATLAQCFVFSAESSVNQSQQAKTTSIIRARPNQFLLFLAR